MTRSEYLETTAWVKGEKKHWSPTVKIILAFILGLLALSPAILGIYWQQLLPPNGSELGQGLYRPRDPGCIRLRRDLWNG